MKRPCDAQRNALVRAHLARQPRRFEDVTPIEPKPLDPNDVDLGFPLERWIREPGADRELREFVVMVLLLVALCLGGFASPFDL